MHPGVRQLGDAGEDIGDPSLPGRPAARHKALHEAAYARIPSIVRRGSASPYLPTETAATIPLRLIVLDRFRYEPFALAAEYRCI